MKANMVAIAATVLLAMGLAAQGADEKGAATGCEKGNCTLLLSGSGHSSYKDNKVALDAEVAHFCMENASLGLRQTVAFQRYYRRSAFAGTTALAADWFWPAKSVIPFAGAGVGLAYREGTDAKPFVAPEVGVRKIIGDNAFVNAAVEYAMYYDQKVLSPDSKWSSRYEYRLGLGVIY